MLPGVLRLFRKIRQCHLQALYSSCSIPSAHSQEEWKKCPASLPCHSSPARILPTGSWEPAAGGYPPFMSGWGHKTGWRMVFKSGKEKKKSGVIKGPRAGICCKGSKGRDLVHWPKIWSDFTLPKPWDYLNPPLQHSHNCAQPGAKHRYMQSRVRLRQAFHKGEIEC